MKAFSTIYPKWCPWKTGRLACLLPNALPFKVIFFIAYTSTSIYIISSLYACIIMGSTVICACPESISPSFTNKSLFFLQGTILPLSILNLLQPPSTTARPRLDMFLVPSQNILSSDQSDCVRNYQMTHPSQVVSIYSRTWDRGALVPLGLLGSQNAQAQARNKPENKTNKEESKTETKQRSSLDGIFQPWLKPTHSPFKPKSV